MRRDAMPDMQGAAAGVDFGGFPDLSSLRNGVAARASAILDHRCNHDWIAALARGETKLTA
jgi:hypothetical protein